MNARKYAKKNAFMYFFRKYSFQYAMFLGQY